ncbi:tbc1 domain family member 2a-like [Stylonychia lemnae]|uniref:Tbc1 domain family member 2a-like n=1 Tax=Stylonychia lemnae TaxID=5949 RepID=A0A077ZVB1_STYLE|nr:tbc1 domain family member 2a-like [Stylonychia lemnae]|eukprot:CDW73574.1 tbc1 domain family member 2a-like [Stylonychia lemnae]
MFEFDDDDMGFVDHTKQQEDSSGKLMFKSKSFRKDTNPKLMADNKNNGLLDRIDLSHDVFGRKQRRVVQKHQAQNFQLRKKIILTPQDQNEFLENLLIRNKPQILSKDERKILKAFCKKGLSERYRKHLWLRASGASAMINLPENRQYYRNLKKQAMDYPNPCFNQINLDLRRTFFELKINKSEQLIDKLRNVLAVYTKRNPTIGYCQGMNFLVGRILKVMQSSESTINETANHSSVAKDNFRSNSKSSLNENDNDEVEAFWIFVNMVESMLPIDYYSNMVGVVIDQKIFYDQFKLRIPDLCHHLDRVGFDPSLLAFQWLVCFLSYNLPQEVSVKVWDLFFLQGTKIIFKVSLALLHLMKGELMKAREFSEIFETLETFPRKTIDYKTLIQTTQLKQFKIRNRDIRYLREQKREGVQEELKKLVLTKDIFRGTYQRLKFMNKFYLYSGLQKMYENQDSIAKEVFQKSLDNYEQELMKIFNCNTKWPICLFDFTYKNKIPQFLCFRTSTNPPVIIEEYFNPFQRAHIIEEYDPERKNEILMERGQHYCNHDPRFIENFKILYNNAHEALFGNANLLFDITSEMNSLKSLRQFMKEIANFQGIEEFRNKSIPSSRSTKLIGSKISSKLVDSVISTEKDKQQNMFQKIEEIDHDILEQDQQQNLEQVLRDKNQHQLPNSEEFKQSLPKMTQPRYKTTLSRQFQITNNLGANQDEETKSLDEELLEEEQEELFPLNNKIYRAQSSLHQSALNLLAYQKVGNKGGEKYLEKLFKIPISDI